MPRSAPHRRSLAAFLSAAVALAALSASAPSLAQKPHSADAKKKPKKDSTKETHKDKDKSKGKKDKAAHAGSGATNAAAEPHKKAAKSDAPIEVKPVALNLPITKLTLDNGLRVVLNVDHTSPTVAVAVVYDVGARNEEKGRSGFAHLFEHMMFQGSKNVKKGEHFTLVTGHGGVLNGTTNSDRTNYFEMLPANELALGLWLEADRMASLDVSQENFENQRKVVQEEYRMRVSNVAYAPSQIRLEELVYQGSWPYEHDAIGTMADLDAAQLDWVKDFHAKHYGPNNAVLTISGDFEAADATALVHKYFDKIPKITVTPFVDAALPEQTSQRTAVIKDEHAHSAGVLYGFPAPAMRDPGTYALDLAARILGRGESSRLYQLAVKDKGVVQSIESDIDARRGPSLFVVDAKLTPEAKVADVEALIDGVMKDLATKGPTAEELAKAQRNAQTQLVLGLQTNGARARMLGEYETYFGDAALLSEEPGRYLAVTADDVKKAVADHLAATKRTVVETYPLEEAKAEDAKADEPKKKKHHDDAAQDPAAKKANGDAKKKKAKVEDTTAKKKDTDKKKSKPKKKGGTP
ncbi:MAG: pitrilysin family protein [Polyangiaceae bacterium]